MKKIILAALGAALIGFSVNANAAQESSTVNPTLTISSVCTLDTTNFVVDFGTHVQGSADLTFQSIGTIDVQCPNGLAYMVGIDAGQHFFGERRLVHSILGDAEFIDYLLQTTTFGIVLGDTGLNAASQGTYTETHSSAGYADTGTGAVQQIGMAIDTTNLSTAVPGTYGDTIVISVVW